MFSKHFLFQNPYPNLRLIKRNTYTAKSPPAVDTIQVL
ncbi:hypothetical protein PAUR_b0965 [Pseudoalteromonas aurantia 208]|uniref:Orphan protein n=1 Tax=Pseudoalteromonas aurantia 208 TaxID=1314867 RepID=A0ABR9EIX6_9GAMM|nr:hypothetical protein [Pseudoalteromonas aurantia 208]